MTTRIPTLICTALLGLAIPLCKAEDNCHDPACGEKSDPLKAVCEHKIPTYTCDECRYEVGVVKISPELLAQGTNGPALVQLGAASSQKVEQGVETVGEIILNENNTVRLSSPVPGILGNIRIDTGMAVKPGDTLAEIESAEVGAAIGNYVRNRALADIAHRNHEREKTLAAQKVSAQVDADEAETRHENARADRDAAAHTLRSMGFLESELAGLKAETPPILPIRATRGGTLIEKQAVAGNRIQPGQPAMTVSDLSSVWVLLDLYERDLAAVIGASSRHPLPVLLETRAFPGRRFKGMIETVGATMDETTRTVKARALVPNPDGLLRPGMFCNARVMWDLDEETLTIPRHAALEDGGAWFVFTRLKDDYFIRTPIRKGREFSESVEVLEGLAAGQAVVAEGAFLLKSDVLREKMGAGCAD